MVILAALPGIVSELLVNGKLVKPGNFSAIVNFLGSRIRKVGLGSMVLSLSAALAMRAGLRPEQLDMDELEYYTVAGQVADGSYEFYPRRTVGHLLVLGALRKAFDGRLVPIQLAVSAIFSLTAPLAYLVARRELRDNRAALLGGLGVMAWPLFVWYGATLYSETVALPLFAAFLLAVPGSWKAGDGRGGRWFGAGLVLGLCMHCRPMYLLYSPFGALVAYWRGRGGWAGPARAALFAAGCLTVVLPWSLFMTAREGTPVLLCSSGGETIAGGLNPQLLRIEHEEGFRPFTAPNGRSTWVGPGKWLSMADTGYLSPEELRLPYSQQSKLLTHRTVGWVTTCFASVEMGQTVCSNKLQIRVEIHPCPRIPALASRPRRSWPFYGSISSSAPPFRICVTSTASTPICSTAGKSSFSRMARLPSSHEVLSELMEEHIK